MLHQHAIRSSRSQSHGCPAPSIDEHLYRNPEFGYAVTWTDPWALAGPDAVEVSTSDPGTEAVVIRLTSGPAVARIAGIDRLNLLDAAEIARYWTSPAYLSRFTEFGTKVVLSQHVRNTVAVVTVSPGATPDELTVMVKESYDLGSRFLIQVTFTADLTTFHEAFRSLQQSVMVEGRAPLRGFDVDILCAVLP